MGAVAVWVNRFDRRPPSGPKTADDVGSHSGLPPLAAQQCSDRARQALRLREWSSGVACQNVIMDDALAQLVGKRLKGLRLRSGVSLREQARMLGISPSSLSAVENGRGGISLKRLQHVALHYDLVVSDLLGPQSSGVELGVSPPVEVTRRGDAAPPGIRRGKGTYYRVLGAGHGHSIQSASVTFEPGGGYEEDAMAHEGEEFVYVVYGDIDLLHGGETYRLAAGESARFTAAAPHAYRNASKTDMAHIIAAATPPW